MQVTKIFCDCCGKEFTKEKSDTFGDVDVNVMTSNWVLDPIEEDKREIKRFKSGDVCGECATKIYEFINKLKGEK